MNTKCCTLFIAVIAGRVNAIIAQDSTRTWSFEAGVIAILYQDTTPLVNPAFSADRHNLHLEARYNWEDRRTVSVWCGRWFGFGNALHVDVAPMAGVVFGLTQGIAPGYTLDATWKSLALYSTSEYMMDLQDGANNFTYTWTELTVDLDHLLVGVVVQRTRTFASPLDLQRGLVLMREQGNFTFGMYTFNAFWTDPTVALNLAYVIDRPRERSSNP